MIEAVMIIKCGIIMTAFIIFICSFQRSWEENRNICMKIVFWGNERNCGITTNMLILADYLVWHRGYRLTIFELVREDYGVKTYFSEPYTKYRKAYLETLVEKQMYYVSGEKWKKQQKRRRRRSEKRQIPSILDCICYVEQNMDLVLVNLANRKDEEARKILREANVVIVNVTQSEAAFETFFASYANLSEHIFFLIGSYFEDKDCDMDYLSKKYRILKENMGVIPFNPELQYICQKKRLNAYIRCNDEVHTSGMKAYFMKEIEQTAEKILNI